MSTRAESDIIRGQTRHGDCDLIKTHLKHKANSAVWVNYVWGIVIFPHNVSLTSSTAAWCQLYLIPLRWPLLAAPAAWVSTPGEHHRVSQSQTGVCCLPPPQNNTCENNTFDISACICSFSGFDVFLNTVWGKCIGRLLRLRCSGTNWYWCSTDLGFVPSQLTETQLHEHDFLIYYLVFAST